MQQFFQVIRDFFSNLFGPKPPPDNVIPIGTPAPEVVIKPPVPPTTSTTTATTTKPSTPATTSGGKKIPTREEFVQAARDLIDGRIPNGLSQPYKTIREPKGDNRSKDIDKINTTQGGGIGGPYCMCGSQHLLDRLCLHFGVERSKVKIPEGPGTQAIAAKVKAAGLYGVPAAVAGGWVIWQHGQSDHGHVETTLTKADKQARPYHYDTFGFNTSGDSTSGVVRNGQGCYYRRRSSEQVGDMHVKIYVDIYKAVIDAMK